MLDNLNTPDLRKVKFFIKYKTRLRISETIISVPSLKPRIAEPFKEILETPIHSFQDILEYLRMYFFLKIDF